MNKTEFRILVISDTHGDFTVCNRVINKELPFDYLVHCGDAQVDPDRILDRREQYGLLAVRGNCDWFVKLPEYLLRTIGDQRLLITHGHRQDVHRGYQYLIRNARQNGAGVVLCGHTHQPLVKRFEDVLLINPGSLTQNRPYGKPGTYAVLTVSEGRPPEAEIIELEED